MEGFSEVLHNEVAPLGIKVTIVEPGAFRTDWGGTSMRLVDVHPDYTDTVGRVHDYRRQVDGLQPGDPARAAAVLLDVVAAEEPRIHGQRLVELPGPGPSALVRLVREPSRVQGPEAD